MWYILLGLKKVGDTITFSSSTFSYKFPQYTLLTDQDGPGPGPVDKLLEHGLPCTDTQPSHSWEATSPWNLRVPLHSLELLQNPKSSVRETPYAFYR